MSRVSSVALRLWRYLRRRIAFLSVAALFLSVAVLALVLIGLGEPERVAPLGVELRRGGQGPVDPLLAFDVWRKASSWLVAITAGTLAVGGPWVREWPESAEFTRSLPPSQVMWMAVQIVIAVGLASVVGGAAILLVLVGYRLMGIGAIASGIVSWALVGVMASASAWASLGAFLSALMRSSTMSLLAGLLLLLVLRLSENSMMANLGGYLTGRPEMWGHSSNPTAAATCLLWTGVAVSLGAWRVSRAPT